MNVNQFFFCQYLQMLLAALMYWVIDLLSGKIIGE